MLPYKETHVDVLGADYSIIISDPKTYPHLSECNGYTDTYTKLIVVTDCSDFRDRPNSTGNVEAYQRKIIRHELIHAFLFESGLDYCSTQPNSWATEEEIVDWFALQSPKIIKAFTDACCMEER